jgi:hypothetical protein
MWSGPSLDFHASHTSHASHASRALTRFSRFSNQSHAHSLCSLSAAVSRRVACHLLPRRGRRNARPGLQLTLPSLAGCCPGLPLLTPMTAFIGLPVHPAVALWRVCTLSGGIPAQPAHSVPAALVMQALQPAPLLGPRFCFPSSPAARWRRRPGQDATRMLSRAPSCTNNG